MTISRRGLMQAAGTALAGFAIPGIDKIPAPTTAKGPFGLLEPAAAMWVVFIAGNCRNPDGFRAFEAGQQSARDAGFTVLDSMHHTRERSRFLARKEVTESYAREQERQSVICKPAPFENSDLQDIAEGIVALWIETA